MVASWSFVRTQAGSADSSFIKRTVWRFSAALLLFMLAFQLPVVAQPSASGGDHHSEATGLQKSASWRWPDVSNYEQHLASYLDQRQADDDVRTKLESFWSDTEDHSQGPEFLDRLLSASAIVDQRLQGLLDQHNNLESTLDAPGNIDWLTSDVPGWLQDTVRLACGRSFAQRRLYDEALESMTGLELHQVCDPSSLIFYRSVCEHNLLKQQECLSNLDKLLERKDELPARFSQLALMMKADLEPLKEDSLDEIARMMRDVERRLDLGRAGQRVRDEEQKIVDKLDKLIDQIEQQMQEQQQSRSQQSDSSQQQMRPMDDSQVAGGSGPGDVDNKDIGERAGWGNLPPAERQQALQRLTEELPSHYRDVIEGYFRELAKDR